jgi:hypothetical protein
MLRERFKDARDVGSDAWVQRVHQRFELSRSPPSPPALERDLAFGGGFEIGSSMSIGLSDDWG